MYQLYLTYLMSNPQYNNFPHIVQLQLWYTCTSYKKQVRRFKVTCTRE